jgi:predicted DNA-binding transcriptional regulator AlpA
MDENELPTTYFINPLSLIDIKELSQIIKLDRKTICKRIKDGTFPSPVKLLMFIHLF